jgi:hypothetical protein
VILGPGGIDVLCTLLNERLGDFEAFAAQVEAYLGNL